MKTASFQTYQGPGRISIARYAPRNTPAGFRIFKNLAPGPWFNSVSPEEYRDRFAMEILAPLDPQKTLDELTGLAAGAEPVLLCWEKPPFTATNWCHRRIVAAWFEKHLGLKVDELETSGIAKGEPAQQKLTPQAQRLGIVLPEGGEIARAAKVQRRAR